MPCRWRIVGHLDPHRCRKVLTGLGISGVETLGNTEGDDRVDRGREVLEREPAHLRVRGQHHRGGALPLATRVGLDDDRIARAPATRDLDDVAGAELLQTDRSLGPPTGRSGLGGLLLDVTNLVAVSYTHLTL